MVGYIRLLLHLFNPRDFSMARVFRSPKKSLQRGTVGLLLAVGWAVTTSCATDQLYSDCAAPSSPCPPEGPNDQDAVLFLIGDAGDKEFDDNPVLQHLKTAVTGLDERGVSTTVLFLGDNVYDEGVREGYPEDLRLLGAQVEVVAGTSAKGIFVPGNHDWANGAREKGLERILNQAEALEAFDADVSLRPRSGCPGPERENLVDSRGGIVATLVLLDTSWWMLEPSTDPACNPSMKADVIPALERMLSEAPDVPVIVAAHHPLKSGGPHGGNFGFKKWLGNQFGSSSGDLNAPEYRTLIDSLSAVFGRASQPIIYAAGHEHSLQVMDEAVAGASVLHLVSGSGSKVTAAEAVEGSRFVAGLPGYMRLDFRSGGRIQLTVVAECSVEAVHANLCPGGVPGRFQSVYRARVR